MGDNVAELGTDLLDVSEMSLAEMDSLAEAEGSALSHALRRILDDSAPTSVARFTSHI